MIQSYSSIASDIRRSADTAGVPGAAVTDAVTTAVARVVALTVPSIVTKCFW